MAENPSDRTPSGPSLADPKPLTGLTLVSFESRMADAMVKLIEKQGGRAVSAPSMQEIPLERNEDAFHFAEKLCNGEIDILICLTGVGTRALIQTLEKRYPLERIVQELARLTVVARGPKPVRVLNEYKIPIAVRVPEPNTWREILQEMDDHDDTAHLDGRTVAVQEYGENNEALTEAIKKRGAKVVRVPIYRWALPQDTAPLKSAIRTILDGKADAVLFTNKVQADHLLRVSDEEGARDALRLALKRTLVASIGPVCTEGLLAHKISVDLEPEHSTIGAFVLDVSQKARQILSQKRSGEADAVRDRVSAPRPAAPAGTWSGDSVFMKACRCEKTEYTPVWLMRQAGRYMPEYREMRRKYTFLDFCKNKDLVTEITVRAQEFLKADAAIIFADILLLVESFGLDLSFERDEGPVIETSVAEGKVIPPLDRARIQESLGYVFAAIRQTRAALKPNIPLLGFAGAPFTLASYMIEGGGSKTFRKTKMLMYTQPKLWNDLLGKLADALVIYLQEQVAAGVQAVQLFDSWVGCLSPDDYRKYAMPFSKRIFDALKNQVPAIHFGTGSSALLKDMSEAGGDVIGVDFRIRLGEAWDLIGRQKGIQGNLDPVVLCTDKTQIKTHVERILDQAKNQPGHIFNLGHGILPETPPENAQFLVEIVHEISRR